MEKLYRLQIQCVQSICMVHTTLKEGGGGGGGGVNTPIALSLLIAVAVLPASCFKVTYKNLTAQRQQGRVPYKSPRASALKS